METTADPLPRFGSPIPEVIRPQPRRHPFSYYCLDPEVRDQIRQAYPDWSWAERLVQLRSLWSQLPLPMRQPYLDRAARV